MGVGSEGPAAVAAKRVVKEGRKYGLGAMVVSQRPSEIDSTILSQCGTMFAMRLSNNTDRSHVTGTAKPIPRWDVHFREIDDDRKHSTAPHITFSPNWVGTDSAV